MQATKKAKFTIWTFIGFILIIYGVIISGAGIYYLFHPPIYTALYQLDPSLWWGLILLVSGCIFYRVDLRRRLKNLP